MGGENQRWREHGCEGLAFFKWVPHACATGLMAVREAVPLKLRPAPLIFLATIITYLVGGLRRPGGSGAPAWKRIWNGKFTWTPRTAG